MNLRIDRSETVTVFAVEENGQLMDLRLWPNSEQDPRYQLHVARVKKLLPAVGGAILDLGSREAYLGWQDLDPARKRRGSKIGDGLKLEERLLVQIRRAESGDKADKATLRLAIPGAYGVYLPLEPGISISSKIRDPQVRTRLETQVDCEDHEGMILRTLAAEVSIKTVNREMGRLRRAYHAAKEEAARVKTLGALTLDVDPEPAFFARWAFQAQTLCGNDPADERWAAEWGLTFVSDSNPLDPLWADFSALRRREVSLKGMEANILVEELETLTAVDVNRRSGSHASVSKVDAEAVREAMRQLRLRNIGGMVVIDVIDKRGASRTTRSATAAKKLDSNPIRIFGPSAMGLIELVRTKRGASLKQVLGTMEAPTATLALWRLELELRRAPKASLVRIQGSPALIEKLQETEQWKSWQIPSSWKRVIWESQNQAQEFLRILPSLHK